MSNPRTRRAAATGLVLTTFCLAPASAAPSAVPTAGDGERTGRCLERVGDPVPATSATLQVPARWDKSQPTWTNCYFSSPGESLRLKTELEGLNTRVRHVRKHRAEAVADAEHTDYREKHWSVRGKEVRWVFSWRGRTVRIALSDGIRLELRSAEAWDDRANEVMRRALRTLDVREVQP